MIHASTVILLLPTHTCHTAHRPTVIIWDIVERDNGMEVGLSSKTCSQSLTEQRWGSTADVFYSPTHTHSHTHTHTLIKCKQCPHGRLVHPPSYCKNASLLPKPNWAPKCPRRLEVFFFFYSLFPFFSEKKKHKNAKIIGNTTLRQ